MNSIAKYVVFALLMVAAVLFSVHEIFFLGTGFLLISAVFAVVFLHDDDNDGFYKLT